MYWNGKGYDNFQKKFATECGRGKLRGLKFIPGEEKEKSDYKKNVYRFISGRRHQKLDGIACSRSNVCIESVGQIWYLDRSDMSSVKRK